MRSAHCRFKGSAVRNPKSEISQALAVVRNGPERAKAQDEAVRAGCLRLVESLPKGRTAEVLGRQLLRSGTSAGANYRAACRAKSAADFIAKMGIVEEEADESIYWMELLAESGGLRADDVEALMKEADELLAISVSSIKTARARKGSRER